MNSGKVLLGVLAGVAAGAALGILFAPDKGSSTRKKIARKSDDYAEELEDNFNEFIGRISEKFDNLKEKALRVTENGKGRVEEFVTDLSAFSNNKAQ
jgi:gas vesicle protein